MAVKTTILLRRRDKSGSFVHGIIIGLFLVIIFDIILEILFYRFVLESPLVYGSVSQAMFSVSGIILVSFFIPGFVAATLGRRGREVTSTVLLSFIAVPLLVFISTTRNSSDLNPVDLLIHLGAAISIVLGGVVKGIARGSFKEKSEFTTLGSGKKEAQSS